LENGCASMKERQAKLERETAIANRLNNLATNQDLKIIVLAKYPDERITFRFIPETQPKDDGAYVYSPDWLANEKLELLWIANSNETQNILWRDETKPRPYWHDREDAIDDQLKALRGVLSGPSANTPSPSENNGGPTITLRRAHVPFVLRGDLNHMAVQEGAGVTSLIYTCAPTPATAAVAVVGDGVVLLDELGGEHGVTFYTLPTGQTIALPRDRGEAIKNLAKVTINPVEGARLAVKVGQSIEHGQGGVVKLIIPPFVPRHLQDLVPHPHTNPGNIARKVRHWFHH
jgi:hypothetical protein